MEARKWRPGQSGNPSGRSGLFQEMQRRAREATPELIDYLLEIARDGDEDARNRIVAIQIMLERGWGKVPICEPESLEQKPEPDWSRLTPEQREQIRAVVTMLKAVAVYPQPNGGDCELVVKATSPEGGG
jgi:hypothetical protein